MKFSLILATIHRTTELERFLLSLDSQTHRDFELIVVDQNDDDRVASILDKYKNTWTSLHLRSEKGLSKARNLGIQHVTGDIVCFPDDDCWYSPGLLKQVANLFTEHPEYDGITGVSKDDQGLNSAGNFDSNSGYIDKFNVWKRANSITIFIKRSCVQLVKGFHPSLGIGAGTLWGSGEETDMLLRVLQHNKKIYYISNLYVGHPATTTNYKQINKALSYGRGMGRVLNIHQYPIWYVAYSLLRPIGGTLFSLFKGQWPKTQYHWANFLGRYQGWQSKL